MSDVLQTRLEDRVLSLILNRPEKRNALSMELSHALVTALDEADADPNVGAILIAANGKAFCAGMDLSEIGQVSTERLDFIHESLFTSGARLTKPIIAAVSGAALAGGTGLVANAHIVFASKEAIFGLTEIRIGLWPLLVFRSVALAVGERRAMEMSLTGRTVQAAEAREMGLVSELADAPLERAAEVSRNIARLSTFTVKNGMASVHESRGLSWKEAGEVARSARAQMLGSRDFAEGVAAFREKREPRWNAGD